MIATLETPRLRLRPCDAGSVAELHALWTTPHARRFLFDDRAISRDEAERFVTASTESFARDGWGLWAVFEHGREDLAGFAGLLAAEDGPPNLVYGVRADLAGRGYASEAATAVLRHALDTLGLARVGADVDEPNEASVRVLEKLGMKRVRRAIVNGRPLLYFSS